MSKKVDDIDKDNVVHKLLDKIKELEKTIELKNDDIKELEGILYQYIEKIIDYLFNEHNNDQNLIKECFSELQKQNQKLLKILENINNDNNENENENENENDKRYREKISFFDNNFKSSKKLKRYD